MSTMDAQTRQRSLGSVLAVALLGVTGLTGVLVGPYLVALGSWLVSEEVDAAPLVFATEAIVGTGVMGVGIASFAAAIGMWRGRPWAWPVAMFVASTLFAGMALIAALDIWVAPYALVVGLAVVLLGSLLSPSVRRAYGLAG